MFQNGELSVLWNSMLIVNELSVANEHAVSQSDLPLLVTSIVL